MASPTFFYFNFYSGLIPLGLLVFGFFRYGRLKPHSRFFLLGFSLLILWSLGCFLRPVELLHIPFPGFLEPAKSWVLINVFELLALGFLSEDLFPRPGKWKWPFLAACLLNLLYPIWTHPLEANLIPPSARLESEAQEIKSRLGSGRVLGLPDPPEHQALYSRPCRDPRLLPLFKRFIPNSNLLASLPLATFYGSTQPSWGALDAGFYFQYVFPERNGNLMDLLGVDLIELPQDNLPPPFLKISRDGKWTLWKNSRLPHPWVPISLSGSPPHSRRPRCVPKKASSRRLARAARPTPGRNSSWSLLPISRPPQAAGPPGAAPAIPVPANEKNGFLVVTQNAMPGWRAWVDGVPETIYLADGLFQGVAVKGGDKEVRLSYEPASFRIGLFFFPDGPWRPWRAHQKTHGFADWPQKIHRTADQDG